MLVAQETGARFYSAIEQALNDLPIDAVIVSSPNPFHYEQALACIERAIPILVEKPVTNDLIEARQLAAAVAASKVPLLVGHHRAHSPLMKAAKGFLDSSEFGRLVMVQGAALFYKPAHYFDDGPWRKELGGGPILINLIHEIDMVRRLCGEVEAVSALASNRMRGFDVEDSVTMNFRLVNGALGNFILSDVAASSKSWEMTSGENPAYPHDGDQNCYHFAGMNGSLEFPTMRTKHYAQESERSWWRRFEEGRLKVEPRDPLERQLEHFVQVIRGNATPLVSARDGYFNMLVVDAIRRSIESGSTELVELPAAD
jgi:predicted dehydrogenase